MNTAAPLRLNAAWFATLIPPVVGLWILIALLTVTTFLALQGVTRWWPHVGVAFAALVQVGTLLFFGYVPAEYAWLLDVAVLLFLVIVVRTCRRA